MSEHNAVVAKRSLSVVDIWQIVQQSWRIIAFVVALSTVSAVIAAIVMTPVYKAEVKIMPVSQDESFAGISAMASQFGGLASLAGLDLGANDNSVVSLAVLKSRSFAEDFIVEERLMPILFSARWDGENDRWLDSESDGVPTIRDAYRRFDKQVRSVSEDKRSGIVTLAIRWTDPIVAADWANLLVARLNERLRQEAQLEAARSIEYLSTELDATTYVGLRQGIHQLIENEIRKATLANVRKEFAYRVIDPAVALDADMFERPRRALIVLLGLMLGLILGTAIAVGRQISLEAKY